VKCHLRVSRRLLQPTQAAFGFELPEFGRYEEATIEGVALA
jgi:hypothetical protein